MLLRLPHAVRAGRGISNPTTPLVPAFSSRLTSTCAFKQHLRPFSLSWKSNLKMASEDPEKQKQVRKYLQQSHDRIFENNKKWAEEMKMKKPEFFADLAAGQSPEYLWIGCSDSRIPAEALTGVEPGEMFIHRNIANLVNNIDLNVMSVVNYAVRHLKVKHIVVCGHYGCGGVKAAMTPKDMGLLNPWLRNIRDVYRLHQDELDTITDENKKYDRLVELNVHEQCRNLIKTAAVQQCWAENEFPVVHGWVFGFQDGLLKDLKFDHEGQLAEIQKIYDLTKDF
ncbi:carbonic anhydrase [Ampelomyces quisqualis]|uniref:Carbonic anhydrase n=1 Tax=Ampelomyces quisqualis TaxID=50730 RepID=A0A6A5QYN6_AMPQU|nr:carbonic anhydrase [Ampelomyces quisqualis]